MIYLNESHRQPNPIDQAHRNLACVVLVDGFLVASRKRAPFGRSVEGEEDSPERARRWLQSGRARRWLELLGINPEILNEVTNGFTE